jgi:hypothetical protein
MTYLLIRKSLGAVSYGYMLELVSWIKVILIMHWCLNLLLLLIHILSWILTGVDSCQEKSIIIISFILDFLLFIVCLILTI